MSSTARKFSPPGSTIPPGGFGGRESGSLANVLVWVARLLWKKRFFDLLVNFFSFLFLLFALLYGHAVFLSMSLLFCMLFLVRSAVVRSSLSGAAFMAGGGISFPAMLEH